MQRMAITTTYEALEMSGYVSHRTPSTRLDRIGTLYGQKAAAMAKAAQQLGNAGFKCTQLKVPFAFHSDQIDPILDELEQTATAITFSPPKIHIISPLLGRPLDGGEVDATYIRNHARKAVDFLGGLLSSQSLAAVDENTLWVHITKEEVTGEAAVVETETNLSREDILPSVTGHLCNGAPLCPSSLYADVAMTVSNYAFKLLRSNAQTGLNVADLEVPKALGFDGKLKSHVLRCTVEANASLGYARVVFHTQDGSKRTDHALCKVYYGDENCGRPSSREWVILLKSASMHWSRDRWPGFPTLLETLRINSSRTWWTTTAGTRAWTRSS